MDEGRDELSRALQGLTARDKQAASARILDSWVIQADNTLTPGGTGGRLRWLVASTVAIAALQRAMDSDGRVLFLLKGCTLLQHRLGRSTRATKDVDGLIRGDIERFLDVLDDALALPALGHFGFPEPDALLGLAMRFQIAQKLHAGSDPHCRPRSSMIGPETSSISCCFAGSPRAKAHRPSQTSGQRQKQFSPHALQTHESSVSLNARGHPQ